MRDADPQHLQDRAASTPRMLVALGCVVLRLCKAHKSVAIVTFYKLTQAHLQRDLPVILEKLCVEFQEDPALIQKMRILTVWQVKGQTHTAAIIFLHRRSVPWPDFHKLCVDG